MQPLSLLITSLSVFLSLNTIAGILIHDTRVGKAVITVISTSPASPGYQAANTKLVNFATDAHTHVERHTLSQSLRTARGDNPRIPPRAGSEKKYLSQKNLGLGHDPFDSYALPLA